MDPELLFSLISIVVLILISGFFSGSETGLTAISRARIRSLEKEGNVRAQKVAGLRDRKEALIGTILLGNNLVNIAASALATSVAIHLFGFEGVAYATLVMTLVVLVFAEVLPKTYAIQQPERVALAVAPIFNVLIKLFSPVTWFVQIVVNACFRLFGVDTQGGKGLVSAADVLRGAIELHHEQGEMIKQEKDMLGSILDLSDVAVREIMIHRRNVVMIDVSLPTSEILRRVLESPYTRIPLWEESKDNIVGVLHAKSLLKAIRGGENMDAIDVRSIANDPWFIPENTSLRAQLHAFRQRRSHFALVVDEYGALEGIVTLEDILEEIVGQIDDETDLAGRGIRSQGDGTVVVEGTVTIRDLNREMDWNLPDENASTIAGLLMHEARVIPEAKESFILYGHRFTVLQRRGNQLTRIRIEPEFDKSSSQ